MYSNLEACRGVSTVFNLSWFMLYTLVINVLMLPGIYIISRGFNNVDECSFILERTLI